VARVAAEPIYVLKVTAVETGATDGDVEAMSPEVHDTASSKAIVIHVIYLNI
jgi:hypothetical protein